MLLAYLRVSVGISDTNAQRQSSVTKTDSYRAGIPAFISATQHRVSFTVVVSLLVVIDVLMTGI